MPGSYEFSHHSSRINLLLDRSISADALDALRKIAEQAKANEITPEQAKAAAEKIAPGVGKLFDVSNWSDQARATLYAAIIAAATAIVVAKIATSSPPASVNVQPVIERIIERPVFPPPSVNTPNPEEQLKTPPSARADIL